MEHCLLVGSCSFISLRVHPVYDSSDEASSVAVCRNISKRWFSFIFCSFILLEFVFALLNSVRTEDTLWTVVWLLWKLCIRFVCVRLQYTGFPRVPWTVLLIGMARKGSLLSFSISMVNRIPSKMLVIIVCDFSLSELLIMKKVPSAFRIQTLGCILGTTLSSVVCVRARNPNIGNPIDVPSICSWMFSQNLQFMQKR